MTLFIRLLDVVAEEKAVALQTGIQDGDLHSFNVEPATFSHVPGSPFAYWISEKIRTLFAKGSRFEGGSRTVKQGLATADDFRFVRCWWEVPRRALGTRWPSFAKGGAFSLFYADLALVLEWASSGAVLKAKVTSEHGNIGKRIYNEEYYYRPGVTWPLRTTSGLGMRVLPAGSIFGHKGPATFVEGNSPLDLLSLCAVTNSMLFNYLVAVQLGAADSAARSYEVGVIQRTPIPDFDNDTRDLLAQLARRAWSIKWRLDSSVEVSHAFVVPAALRARLWPLDPATIEAELGVIKNAIDNFVFRAYRLEGEDRKTIEDWLTKSRTLTSYPEDERDNGGEETFTDASEALYSWAAGVAFRRFDFRLATNERQAPPEPEPFDPLPTRSPGMIPETDEVTFPPRPILFDDPGHPLDLSAQVGEVLERVGFAPESPETLRRWLARDFFPLHVKMYSKSRRKAPIYWQLATPSVSYSVWLYLHAFSRDTLYKVQEISETKLRHGERKLESLRADFGPNPKAADRKALAAQETLVEELRTFLDEVKRVAPLWNPDLDDGVIINFALLWRLVPHHKPWQKELKATWDALCAGEYDWAHLAMHLWPERVVPKCATDRSLAIAHGLEDVFWIEGQDGKWKPRPIPSRPVEELAGERTSPAVKAALKSLLEAPVVTGSRQRSRGTRKGSANA